MDYATYIQSAEWRIVADKALARAGYKCQVCSRTKHLNVHHNTYARVGRELDTDLCVLCRGCHELFNAPVNGKPTRMPGPKAHKQQPSVTVNVSVAIKPGKQSRRARKRAKQQAMMNAGWKRAQEKKARIAADRARASQFNECYGIPKQAIRASQQAITEHLGQRGAVSPHALKTTSPQPTGCNSGATGITPGQATSTGQNNAYPSHSFSPLATGEAAGAGV